MTIHELNCNYYAMFDTLFDAAPKLPEKMFKRMSDILMQEYEQEVQDYLDEQLIVFGMQRFERKFKVANYTPRRRLLFWWNPTAKKLLKKYKAEFLTFLAELEKNTREEKKYAESLHEEQKAPSEAIQQLPAGQCTALTTSTETSPVKQEVDSL